MHDSFVVFRWGVATCLVVHVAVVSVKHSDFAEVLSFHSVAFLRSNRGGRTNSVARLDYLHCMSCKSASERLFYDDVARIF